MEIPSLEILVLVLSMVSWKPTLQRLVLHVMGNEQGAEAGTILSERGVAAWTGMSRTSVWNGFNELVEQQVLVRFDGGGPRGHAYRVNFRPHEWLVPWLDAKPPTMDAAPSREWSAKQEIALNQIYRLVRPEIGHKTRSVARPVGALSSTAARAFASLSGSSRATGRAAEHPLVTRAVARLGDDDDGRAQLPSNRDLSLPSSEEVSEETNRLLAAINERVAPSAVFGSLRREIVSLACDTQDVNRLVALVRSAPPTKSIRAHIDMLRDAIAAPTPVPARMPEIWTPRDTSDAVPPPADLRSWVNVDLPREEAEECQTVDGGVDP